MAYPLSVQNGGVGFAFGFVRCHVLLDGSHAHGACWLHDGAGIHYSYPLSVMRGNQTNAAGMPSTYEFGALTNPNEHSCERGHYREINETPRKRTAHRIVCSHIASNAKEDDADKGDPQRISHLINGSQQA